MASVEYEFTCPQCGNKEAVAEACTTGVEVGACIYGCGYHFDDDPWLHGMRQTRGYGTYVIELRNGCARHGCYRAPGSVAKRIRNLRRPLKSHKVQYVAITRQVGYRKWETLVLKDERKPVFKRRVCEHVGTPYGWELSDQDIPF